VLESIGESSRRVFRSFCVHRYDVSVFDAVSGASVSFVHAFVLDSQEASTLASADLFVEAPKVSKIRFARIAI
jgi:hypothetical protein